MNTVGGFIVAGLCVLWIVWKYLISPLIAPAVEDRVTCDLTNEGRSELGRLRVAVIGTPSYGDLMDETYYVPDWVTLKALCDEYDVPFETTDVELLKHQLEQAIIDTFRSTRGAEVPLSAT